MESTEVAPVHNATLRPPKPAFELTERAAGAVRAAARDAPETGAGLRVRVESSEGCCRTERYELALAGAPGSDEVVVESRSVKVFLRPADERALRGAVLDYVETVGGAGFQVLNEQRDHRCGCDHHD